MSSKSDIVKIVTSKQADLPSFKSSSLRQKELTKAASIAPKETTLPQESYIPPKQNVAEFTITHLDRDPCASDLDVETSSVGSSASSTRRVSLLYSTPKKGSDGYGNGTMVTGNEVVMDMVTGVANTLLHKRLEALESANIMKREAKVTAHDSLQGLLYETVLSLSDSRNHHKCNLEMERSRYARELVHIERAHNKCLKQIITDMSSGLQQANNNIEAALKETQSARNWLGYETTEPLGE